MPETIHVKHDYGCGGCLLWALLIALAIVVWVAVWGTKSGATMRVERPAQEEGP